MFHFIFTTIINLTYLFEKIKKEDNTKFKINKP